MQTKQKGFSTLHILLFLIVIGMIGGTGWYVYKANRSVTDTFKDANNSSTPKSTENSKKATTTKQEVKEIRLSENWLLRESDQASIRVPDGFEILSAAGDNLTFVLPDEPQGTLHYTKGVKAKVVGEPHKHFGLGLWASYNNPGFNDRGTDLRNFKTYSGLNVEVKQFEQSEDPTGVDFPKEAKHLKYRVTSGNNYFNVDYVYLGDGIVSIIDEMVKSIVM
jgi:hypothetical protein